MKKGGHKTPKTCGRCPRWLHAWCQVKCKIMVAAHPACEIGRKLIALEWQKLYERKKRKEQNR